MSLIIITTLVIFIFVAIAQHHLKLKARYEAAKEALRQNPRDGYLRETMLQAGRQYYRNARGGGRLTLSDEQALTNDLIAITGGGNLLT